MTIVIEKNVPIPGFAPRGRKERDPMTQALVEMEIGDSFVVGAEDERRMRNIETNLRQFAKRNKMFVTIRRLQGEGNQIRCWKVAPPKHNEQELE